MIDLKDLRQNPDRYRDGARAKRADVDVDRLLALDEDRRRILADQEAARARQRSIGKEQGPRLGKLRSALKGASGPEQERLEAELRELEAEPARLKSEIQAADERLAAVEPEWRALLLRVPQPPDPDVPVGGGSEDNVELRRWSPEGFDPDRPFAEQRGFAPRSHVDLMLAHGMVEFERAVRIAGARHYCFTGAGMRLQQAVLQLALSRMVDRHGFTPVSVPVLVREECMTGTGFFPGGEEQAYRVEESRRGSGQDLFLAGTGEVGLMGLHGEEILDAERLPIRYVTLSTCFRREAGAAGKDTAGLYRVHQFDKVEQVVICRADEGESRAWHARMIGFVEELLRDLGLPHRLLQCCTGDLGQKNADMIDVECWMPSRGDDGPDGAPTGAWGETHSASRLYDYQCRRLNMRYRGDDGRTVFCHSLNNTVLASPRILIPLVEMHQRADGSIAIPEPLRPWFAGRDAID